MMRQAWLFGRLVLAGAWGMAGMSALAPAPAAPGTGGARVMETTGGFSYVPPAGWRVTPFPGLKYRVIYGRPSGGFAPNINFVDEAANMALSEYAQASLTQMKLHFPGFHFRGQTPFVTASGLRGVRMVADDSPTGQKLQQVFYLLPGRGAVKFVVTASTLASDGAKYNSAIDAAMKTFTIK